MGKIEENLIELQHYVKNVLTEICGCTKMSPNF